MTWIFLTVGIVVAQDDTVPAVENSFFVTDAWIKLAPPGAAVNAAYMKLRNQSLEEKVIVAVTADCCSQVMMHQTRREGDKVYMDHRDSLFIPAQGELHLTPGGLHLMLLGTKAPLGVGDNINIHFDFSDSTQYTISVPVKKAADE
jgi:copper(I)-binding protein